jgi:lysophospholipase L1-like esterase
VNSMSRCVARAFLGGLVLAALVSHSGQAVEVETTLPADDPEVIRWEKEVAALEALDQAEVDPAEAILFIGSSSIRLWETIAADMEPWPVIRRGYGGARYRDLCHFADRLVVPHEPRAIVVFVANDITSPTTSPAAERVMVDVRATQAAIRDRHPRVPVFYVAVTPTESRWSAWQQISALNDAIADLAASEADTFFIPTAKRFLDSATGQPIPALFRKDKLHLSAAGYRIWAEQISAALEAQIGTPVAAEPAGAGAG